MPTGRKASQGTVRIVARKSTTKTPSRDTNGEDLPDSDNEPVEEDDDTEGAAVIDMVSLQSLQKQFTQTNGEVLTFESDDIIHRLHVVVGSAPEYSCFAHLLIHFYVRIQDNERYDVDDVIELVLDYFAEVQCRVKYPMVTAEKVAAILRTAKYMSTTGLGDIHGIPCAAPELHEHDEESSHVPFVS